MRLVYGLLCDCADMMVSRKPIIVGVFDVMRGPPEGPIPFPAASLAYKISVNGFEPDQRPFRLRLLDEDGVESLCYFIDATFGTEVPGGERNAYGAVYLPRNLEFQREGTYVFEFAVQIPGVDGRWEPFGEIPFHVVRVSASG